MARKLFALVIVAMILTGSIVASRANAKDSTPVAIGDDWSVEVVTFYENVALIDPAATWFIDWLKANPAPTGEQVVAVKLTITNTGPTAAYALNDIAFALVSESGFEYDGSCGSAPGSFERRVQLDTGDTATGVLCWSVQTKHIDGLKLRIKNGETLILIPLKSDTGTPVATPTS